MLLLDETSLEIGPEYTADLIHTRHLCYAKSSTAPSVASKLATAASAALNPVGHAAKIVAGLAGGKKLQSGSSLVSGNSASETDETTDDAAESSDKSDKTLLSERFEEQCFLLDAIDLFKKAAIKNQNSYQNFVVLDGDNDDAAKLVSKINSRFGDGLKDFMKITPAQYSMLVPKIRLYVQKFVNEKDKVGTIQELTFQDWTDKSSVEEIMTTRKSRGRDAGLVSFSYEYDGRDPASTTNMIKANLRMLFTDFETITSPIRGLNKKEKGMLTTAGGKKWLQPRFLDLILRQPTRKKVAGSSLPFLTKVHAEIGWQTPQDASGTSFPADLKKYISAGHLNEYFTLYMLEHDLDFKEDGRIEMSVDFRGQIENVLFSRTDVLALDEATEEEFKKQIEKDKARLKKDADIAKKLEAKTAAGGGQGTITTNNPGAVLASARMQAHAHARKKAGGTGVVMTRAQTAAGSGGKGKGNLPPIDSQKDKGKTYRGSEEISRLIRLRERQLEYTIQRQKTARYRKFLNSLGESEKIKFIDLKSQDVQTWVKQLTSANMSSGAAGRIRASTVMQNAGASAANAQTAGQQDVAASSLGAAKKKAKEKEKKAKEKRDAAANDTESDQGSDKDKGSDLDYDSTAADAVHGPEIFRIHFMYLGDIINIASDTLYEVDGNLGMTRLVAGPVQYFDDAGNLKSINLADIPISLDTFSNWIFRNIIAKGLASMSLGSFLNKLTTDLVFNALGGEKCFNSISGTPSMMMTPIVLSLKGTGKHREEVVKRSAATLKYPRMGVKEFTKVAKNNLGSRGDLASTNRVNTATYIFITGVVREENNFNYGIGGFDFDGSKDGIYTLGIGRDRGIVKNIKFNKSSAKYQSEMRIEQRSSRQGSVLGEFRQVYNASVDLVGNTLFKNGQYVKIDPSTMGLDPNTAIQLGLGGYYVITKVVGELSKDGYHTTLTCKYNSTGKVNRKAEKNKP